MLLAKLFFIKLGCWLRVCDEDRRRANALSREKIIEQSNSTFGRGFPIPSTLLGLVFTVYVYIRSLKQSGERDGNRECNTDLPSSVNNICIVNTFFKQQLPIYIMIFSSDSILKFLITWLTRRRKKLLTLIERTNKVR